MARLIAPGTMFDLQDVDCLAPIVDSIVNQVGSNRHRANISAAIWLSPRHIISVWKEFEAVGSIQQPNDHFRCILR